MTTIQLLWGSVAVNVVLIAGLIVMNNRFQRTYDKLRMSYLRSVNENMLRDQQNAYHMKNQQAKIAGLLLRLEDANRRADTLARVNANDVKWEEKNRDPLNMLGYEDTMISGPL